VHLLKISPPIGGLSHNLRPLFQEKAKERQVEAGKLKQKSAEPSMANFAVVTKEYHGGRPSKLDGNRELPSNPPPTLAELGLKKRESRTQGGELIAEKIEHGGDRKTESRSHDATLKDFHE